MRREDDRAAALRATGAEVVVGDLTRPEDVVRMLDGIGRVYFGLSVSSEYLAAAAVAAAVARGRRLELFVNISQMTVSMMSATRQTGSPQHLQQWLAEQIAAEYASGLGRPVRYADIPLAQWEAQLQARRLPPYLAKHLGTMARLHAENAYDRSTRDVETILGRPATSVRDFVAARRAVFAA